MHFNHFNHFKQRISSYDYFFYSLVTIGIVAIAGSFPMMKLRYDLWEHVDRIREMVLDRTVTSHAKRYWYACWAFVFKLYEIDNIFTMAVVIHRVQFIANCAMVYIAAKQLLEPLLSLSRYNKNENQWLSSLAISSVLVWLVSIGTFSYIQQAWIMWYSVNYQITLVFLFLSLSLVVNILTVRQNLNIVIFKSIISIVLILLILLFHAGELAYFIFYAPILLICFVTKLRLNVKQFLFAFAVLIVSLYLGTKFYTDQVPMLLTLGASGEWTKIASLIQEKGTWNVVHGGNRYTGNWNEMYRLNVYAMLLLALLAGLGVLKTNRRILSFIALSLVFCFAPSFVFSAGFLSLVSYDGIVNRYYFASYLFLAIPVVVYYFIAYYEKTFNNFNPKILLITITIFIIGIVFVYSKFINQRGVFYQNVKSIETSMKAKKLDVEVSDFDIEDIKKQIHIAEATAKPLDFLYCGPYKKIYMVMYLYNRKNVYFDRLRDISNNECEENAKKLNKYVVYIK